MSREIKDNMLTAIVELYDQDKLTPEEAEKIIHRFRQHPRYVPAKMSSEVKVYKDGAVVEPIEKDKDMVNHPPHYKSHPSGIECIEVTQHFNFCLGNTIKYIWRAGEKGDRLEDLKKAAWYLDREIKSEAKRRDENVGPQSRLD